MLAEISATTARVRGLIGKAALDERVMRAMGKVPRHEFVPIEVQAYAYANRPLSIGYMEPRAGAKGNADQQTTCRAQNRESVSHALERIREVARHKKKEKFTSLLHHVTIDLLRAAFVKLKRDAAPGVDGMTWEAYEIDREARLRDLHSRVHSGRYRALPSRRRFIPKADGRQRPLAVAALEDKIVQRALTMVLNAIYEADFLGFSYGFRPKRSQHDALDALVVGISGRK